MKINKEDIELLDMILDYLLEVGSIDNMSLYRQFVFKLKGKNLEKFKEKVKTKESFNVEVLPYFKCAARIKEQETYGKTYSIIRDESTLSFKSQGGFQGLYQRQEVERKKQEKADILQDAQLTLTKEQIKDIDRANKKSNISLIIAVISVLVAIASLVFS